MKHPNSWQSANRGKNWGPIRDWHIWSSSSISMQGMLVHINMYTHRHAQEYTHTHTHSTVAITQLEKPHTVFLGQTLGLGSIVPKWLIVLTKRACTLWQTKCKSLASPFSRRVNSSTHAITQNQLSLPTEVNLTLQDTKSLNHFNIQFSMASLR